MLSQSFATSRLVHIFILNGPELAVSANTIQL